MKLKICGIRNEAMVDFCNREKIDYAGFNFVPSSKRKLKLGFAKNLINNLRRTDSIALFMDQRFDEISKVLATNLFKIVQLHGQEHPKLLQKIRGKYNEITIIKAFSETDLDLKNLEKYKKYSDIYLFDGKIAGSGTVIENTTKLAAAIDFCKQNNLKFAIAGGINPENILRFKQEYSFADFLDTASGVEDDQGFSDIVGKNLVTNFREGI